MAYIQRNKKNQNLGLMTEEKKLSIVPAQTSVFASPTSFEEAQRIAKMLANSDLVPPMYRNGSKGVANAVLALDISKQLGISAFTVMQNLQIVEGTPAWKSSYLIERFAQAGIEPEYEFQERGNKTVTYDVWVGPKEARKKESKSAQIFDRACRFKCTRNGKESVGPWVSLEIAIKEGWYFRNGSKWATMPEKMLMYAAAREYNRFYPVVPLNNIPSEDEISDWDPSPINDIDELNQYADSANNADFDDADVVANDDII